MLDLGWTLALTPSVKRASVSSLLVLLLLDVASGCCVSVSFLNSDGFLSISFFLQGVAWLGRSSPAVCVKCNGRRLFTTDGRQEAKSIDWLLCLSRLSLHAAAGRLDDVVVHVIPLGGAWSYLQFSEKLGESWVNLQELRRRICHPRS
jgi:hypothetical protein